MMCTCSCKHIICLNSKLKEFVTAGLCAKEKQNTGMQSFSHMFCYSIWIQKSRSRQHSWHWTMSSLALFFPNTHSALGQCLTQTLSTTRLDPDKKYHDIVICAIALDDVRNQTSACVNPWCNLYFLTKQMPQHHVLLIADPQVLCFRSCFT